MNDEYDAFMAQQNFQPLPVEEQEEEVCVKGTKKWSDRQTAIFEFVNQGNGNGLISAVAGSGKTTTIVHAESIAKHRGSTIFLAFNKAIAEELKERGVNARTFHSLTYMPVTKFIGCRNVSDDKLKKICAVGLSPDDNFIYGNFIRKLVGIAKQCGIICLIEDTKENWMRLVNHYDLELENEKADMERALELSYWLLKQSNISTLVDFDDLLYFPILFNISLPKFDFVFVDESQDTNAIQRQLLRKILKPNSRLVAVGDRKQAIYGFRGSDSDSLDLIKRDFKCKEFPLDISYRCAHNIVKFAQKYNTDIKAAGNANQGEVANLGTNWPLEKFLPADLIVCRTTKPLITTALKFLKQRIPAYIMGRDIGEGLKSIINKLAAISIDDLEVKLGGWAEKETEKALAKQQEGKAESIQDKQDAILALIKSLNENERSIQSLLNVINDLFKDKAGAVVLATIHKSKGLEAERVFWLNSSSCPASWVKLDWQKGQEENLCYVAITRAKNYLGLIEEK